jgi:hypothetical protein
MPVCFQLIPLPLAQGGPLNAPTDLAKIDDAMRNYFRVPPSDKEWLCGWYDSIGLRLAMGDDFPTIRKAMADQGLPSLVRIVAFLEANYTARSFRE